MMRRVRAEHAEGAGARPARRGRSWAGPPGRRCCAGEALGDPAAWPDPEVERSLRGKLERAGSADTREEAALALAEYYLDAARPLEALSLFEEVCLATSDRERRALSEYFLRRLDGKRLDELAGSGGPYGEVLEQFVHIYLRMGNRAVASRYLRMIIEVSGDPEVEANCLFALGQISERAGDFAQAAEHYAAGIRRPRGDGESWYLLHDGLGRCLNACGRFREAEGYCRRALSIDPELPFARETLAASLRGQGRLAEAARCLIRAIDLHPASPGALAALEELVGAHGELSAEIPGLAESLDRCRSLSRSAASRYRQ